MLLVSHKRGIANYSVLPPEAITYLRWRSEIKEVGGDKPCPKALGVEQSL